MRINWQHTDTQTIESSLIILYVKLGQRIEPGADANRPQFFLNTMLLLLHYLLMHTDITEAAACCALTHNVHCQQTSCYGDKSLFQKRPALRYPASARAHL